MFAQKHTNAHHRESPMRFPPYLLKIAAKNAKRGCKLCVLCVRERENCKRIESHFNLMVMPLDIKSNKYLLSFGVPFSIKTDAPAKSVHHVKVTTCLAIGHGRGAKRVVVVTRSYNVVHATQNSGVSLCYLESMMSCHLTFVSRGKCANLS